MRAAPAPAEQIFLRHIGGGAALRLAAAFRRGDSGRCVHRAVLAVELWILSGAAAAPFVGGYAVFPDLLHLGGRAADRGADRRDCGGPAPLCGRALHGAAGGDASAAWRRRAAGRGILCLYAALARLGEPAASAAGNRGAAACVCGGERLAAGRRMPVAGIRVDARAVYPVRAAAARGARLVERYAAAELSAHPAGRPAFHAAGRGVGGAGAFVAGRPPAAGRPDFSARQARMNTESPHSIGLTVIRN